ncbi:Oleosin 18.2 kDa [Turnera subulata]|uniref:Oleosin n=1 Tax=Turnera subulata TaxID=218843 RepID=A0A9Q0FPE6_9ROSI|nr:Oleosin 18.2 kDa [Turnera subulata]
MGDRQPHQVQVHPQRYEGGLKGQPRAGGGPSATKILAVVTLLPVGGGLLALAGMTFAGTLIGLCLATPVFLLFSPVIVPAALVLALAVTAFLASGAFGLTGVTSLSWVAKYLQAATHAVPESLDQAKRRMQDMAGFVGQKTKEMGQEIQRKAHEGK